MEVKDYLFKWLDLPGGIKFYPVIVKGQSLQGIVINATTGVNWNGMTIIFIKNLRSPIDKEGLRLSMHYRHRMIDLIFEPLPRI